MKISINYWYAKLLVKEISITFYRVLIMWPSLIAGSLLFLFFMMGSLTGGLEPLYSDVLSSRAQAYQSAPPGYMSEKHCVELPTEMTISNCVNKSMPLSGVVHQDLKNANSFYCFIVLISMCIEGLYRFRFWLSHKMSRGVYGYDHSGSVSAKQNWDE
ncbi:hypothetical protein OI450_05900 [Pectobacterium cacticida]|uniref:Uncharacterized protein n=1 Tax=Pectobacterium cacticida TaxID=69221 RepID=A0ABZ2G944_9GAMM|nr:hypothetical protein [Pectobacterium cacticida]UYX07904.1 hypothetical protein OI450_05900 [Pectobacterium cacticida]